MIGIGQKIVKESKKAAFHTFHSFFSCISERVVAYSSSLKLLDRCFHIGSAAVYQPIINVTSLVRYHILPEIVKSKMGLSIVHDQKLWAAM